MRSLADAQHEAAHVVVGVALGLRLCEARLTPADPEILAYALFAPGPCEAERIMYAAGVAWERHAGDLAHAAGDLEALRRGGVRGNARLRALERAAWAVLVSRPGAHASVTRALLERDLTAADVRRLARGERVR
jgi:hypothetical protein